MEKILSQVRVTSDEFTVQFQSHPSYPSAFLFSDMLNSLGVKNVVYNKKRILGDLSEESI